MKIAVYTCMKNESKNVYEWMGEASKADHVVILDTMSDDDTVQRLRLAWEHHHGDGRGDDLVVARGFLDPFRFDVALNAALALVPPDVDICIQLAGDERLTGGWRRRLDEAWDVHEKYWRAKGVEPSTIFKIRYRYQFSKDLAFYHDRIHSRRGWSWRYPFHECLCTPHPEREQTAWIGDPPLIVQLDEDRTRPDMAKLRGDRDMRLAEIAIREWPHDARMCFYVGRQMMYQGRYAEALKELMRWPELDRGSNNSLEGEWWADAVRECYRGLARQGA